MNEVIEHTQQPGLLSRVWKNPYFRFLLFGVVLCLLPLFTRAGLLKSSYIINIGGVLIYAIAAMGLNLLLGYSGLISLGTAGFMGLGAYISAYVTRDLGLPFIVAIALTILIPLAIGILVGLVSLRISGLYLAIATLCVSEILRKTFEELDVFTGGFSGHKADYPTIFGVGFSREGTYLLLSVILVLIMILTYNLTNGSLGRALHAMRGSEVAAQAMGVNLLKYRLIAFALATVYASLAGSLYVFLIKFTYPSVWILGMSLNILAVVVIGGMRSIYGTVLGSFVVFAIPDLVLKRLPVIGAIDGMPYIFNGILIIVVIMFYPQGLVQLLSDLKRWITKGKKKQEVEGA